LSADKDFEGVVWPGITAFPDWFNPNTQDYWNNEFASFFDAETGVDIDGLWIDMNEASNFCVYPCSNPEAFAISNGDPPTPPAIRPYNPQSIPGWPADFQPVCEVSALFQLNATTLYGQNIFMTGNITALGMFLIIITLHLRAKTKQFFLNTGNWDISNVAPLNSNAYTEERPLWELEIGLPTNTVVSYKYIFQQLNGSFTYEAGNRTVSVGACGSPLIIEEDAWAGDSTMTVPSFIQQANAWGQESSITEPTPPSPTGKMLGLPGRNYINPPYQIHDAAGSISDLTLATDLMHYNGLMEYDTHNLYGTMMSSTSRNAMINRRPGLRPLVITRSTFAGAGAQVGHWLGDNTATWYDYQISMAESIAFAAIYQLPMVGADVCGYALDTTETLCARWAMLGAFLPFYRNHESVGFIYHEFYRWPLVAEAARIAIKARYQLMDYIYTALHQQSVDGTPTLNPMFFLYPEDSNTFPIYTQYFYGSSLLISPVTEENSTDVTIYLPDDQFYDFFTYEPIRGTGHWTTLTDVNFTSIPVYIKGGSIIPIRVDGANTTTELRQLDFNLIVAPGLDGTATGSLYLDDGVSIDQPSTSDIQFAYDGSRLSMSGTFRYDVGNVKIANAILLGAEAKTIPVNKSLKEGFTISIADYPKQVK
jgi:alpha-glucosidase